MKNNNKSYLAYIIPNLFTAASAFVGVLSIVASSKGEFETFVVVPRGEPDNFLADDEFRTKFNGLCAPYLGDDRSRRLADQLLGLEQANSISAVMAMSQSGQA